MRKKVKSQVQEGIRDILSAIDTIENLFVKADVERIIEILGQTQELAIQIGNTIEASEGSGGTVVCKLEEVCEVLYHLSDLSKDSGERIELLQKLRRLVYAAEEDIKVNIPVRLEVLFLPYQVSMWDSLESVWMAAREREDIDCYVVSVPFYDVKSDNSLGDMHYEGDRYPDYVPVIPFWKYSIEDRKPDIIFFHNPYDEYNRVTRVPEQYYSRNLKKSTDMLVYIPYFVSEEGGPADYQCSLSGVLFADRVIVQPGSVYEKFCRVYTNEVRKNGWDNAVVPARQKFLPLGSPKFDKVRSMKCEIEDLPKEWQRTILKPNGARKKIILYNLSVIPLLENGEQILKKIDSVFNFFKEKREELVLLFRPHPLLIKTINSMVPWLREAYLQRIFVFQKEGWGIYDETPDPNLAMVLSDGYYGDVSSLVTTYRETGKPVMLQNVDDL